MSDSSREIVACAFGSALAEKATEELAARLARACMSGLGANEAVLPAAVTVNFLIASEGPSAALVQRQELAMAGGGGSFSTTYADDGPMRDSDVPGREERIRRLRETFEDDSRGVLSYVRERVPEEGSEPLVETSWLASVARIPLALDLLAEIAHDPAVELIDVPHLVWREFHRTVPLVRAPRYRRAFECTGRDVIVAIVDGEVQTDTDFFGDRVVQRENFTSEAWGNADDHGTAVAGVIAANHEYMIGMAPEAVLYSYKVFSSRGPQDEIRAVRGLDRAIEDGAQVINVSWGRPTASGASRAMERACNTGWLVHATVVTSAGNRGPMASSLTAPCEADGVIAVGATNIDGTRVAAYSSRGPTSGGGARPHLVAPGGEPRDPIMVVGASGIGSAWGSSIAAPHVSGALALMLERDSTLTSEEQRTRLLSMCELLPGFGEQDQGAGLLRMV